jgi:hypothetical protein
MLTIIITIITPRWPDHSPPLAIVDTTLTFPRTISQLFRLVLQHRMCYASVMNIALDYDGTFTRDPLMWEKFIEVAKLYGHNVFVCTMRYPGGVESIDSIKSLGVDVIYTARRAKGKFLADAGIPVDIWVDDMPVWIFENG